MENKSEHEHRKKILGKHIRQFLHKNNVYVTRKFDVLVVQNSIVIMQNNGKVKTKKACSTCKCVFG